MKFLDREGDCPEAKYFNTPASALYLDCSSPRYVGGILVMLNERLFKFWHDLPEALHTGKPQNETKHGQKGVFEGLYEELPRLEQFMGRGPVSRGLTPRRSRRSVIVQSSRLFATSMVRPACFA